MNKLAKIPRKGLPFFILCIFLLLHGLYTGPCYGAGPKITIVISSNIRPYKEALDGFKKALDLAVECYDLKNPELVKYVLTKEHQDFVVAIGPEASRIVHDFSPLPPEKKLYLMVLDPEELLGEDKVCGVDLRIPPDRELKKIHERLKGPLNLGIFYCPEENQEMVSLFSSRARAFGINVTGIPVESPKAVPKAFKDNLGRINTILFIPDSVVIQEALVRYLIKRSVLMGIAVIGYNHFFIENGAVMSLTIQYDKVGEEGARLLKDMILKGVCKKVSPPYVVEWNKGAWNTVRQKR